MGLPRREDTYRSYQLRVLRVVAHIRQHLDDELTLETLAAVAAFSPFHFHYVFRGMVGETVMDYVRRLRLERAWRELQHGSSLAAAALQAGYGSEEAFVRAFKGRFGLTPGESRTAPPAQESTEASLAEHLAARLDRLRSGAAPLPDVTVRRLEPQHAAAMRHTGPYSELGAFLGRLLAWAGPAGLLRSGRMLGLCYDDPDSTPPERCRYDGCVTVAPDWCAPADSPAALQLVAGGDYAVALHRGPHCELPRTYAEVCGQWCPALGRELRAVPCIEHFLDHPQAVPESQLRTEIYVPLADAIQGATP
jgi:AraC family transcriptional regulator